MLLLTSACDLINPANSQDYSPSRLPVGELTLSTWLPAGLPDFRLTGQDESNLANLGLTDAEPRYEFYRPDWPIYTHQRHLAASRIQGCRIEKGIIAEGCHIGDVEIDRCVIGVRTIVESGVRLYNSVFMGVDYSAPCNFLWRIYKQCGYGWKGALAASKAFVRFAFLQWGDNLNPSRRPLFDPKTYFSSSKEVEAYLAYVNSRQLQG